MTRRRWILVGLLVGIVGLTWAFHARYVLLGISGSSMWPLLEDGESIVLRRDDSIPERWAVVAVEAGAAGALSVKRVAALPGEWVQVRGGDVHVGPSPDKLTPAPRTLDQIRAMSVPTEPGDFSLLAGTAPDSGTMAVSDDGRHLILDGRVAEAAMTWPREAAGFTDGGSGPVSVRDLLVTVGVFRAEGPATLTLQIVVQGQVVASYERRLKASDGPLEIEWILVDDRDVVSERQEDSGEGARVLRETSRQAIPEGAPVHLTLRVKGGSVTLAMLDIRRDIHYTSPPGGPGYGVDEPLRLGPRDVFLLGDNSPRSEDGRTWGPVSVAGIVGRPVAVYWPLGRARRLRFGD